MSKEVKKEDNGVNRWKNISTYVGIIGVIGMVLSAVGIDASTLTSWPILWHSFLNVLSNPVLLGSAVCALVGNYANPRTKGIRD